MTPTLLGYIRRSVMDGPDDPTASPARQRAAIERAAAGLGAEVEWFEDLDISGRHEYNRPGWQALLARLNDAGVIGVAVESYDRSHRNVREFLGFADNLALLGKRLISASQNIDMGTADGRMMASVLMAFSEGESRKASERTRATIKHLVDHERRHWGTQPFGTDREPATKHLIPSTRFYWLDPGTGAAYAAGEVDPPGCEKRFYYDGLRTMFDLYAKGNFSFQDLTEALHAGGWYFWGRDLTTPQPFTRQTVRSILQRSNLYAGQLGSVNAPPQRRQESRPGGHQPILPVELCEEVNRVYARRSIDRPVTHSNHSEHTYLLSGVLHCAVCGQRMCGQAQHQTPQRWFYRHLYSKERCKQRITPAAALEGEVIAALTEIVQQEEVIRLLAETLRQDLRLSQNEDNQTALLLQDREDQLARLQEMRVIGAVDLAYYEAKYRALASEIETLKSQLPALQLAGEVEELLESLIPKMDRLGQAEPALLRDLILGFFRRIEAKDKRIEQVTLTEWAEPLGELLSLGSRRLSDAIPTTLIITCWLTTPA